VRTLHADLVAAQKSTARTPHVQVLVQNKVASFRRLDFVSLDATAHAGVKHDVGVTADGAVQRVRVDAGAILHQRVATPATGPWTSWTTLASGMGTVIACAAEGTRVIVFYADAANTTVKYRESTDSGVTFAAEANLLTGAAAVDLACAYKTGSSDLLVVWAYATAFGAMRRTAGVFGGFIAHATAMTPNGVGCDFGFFDWLVCVTGIEATTNRRTLWSTCFGDGIDQALNTWSAVNPQHQFESDAGLTIVAPFVCMVDAPRITFAIDEAAAGGVSIAWRSELHPQIPLTAGPFRFRTPSPLNNIQALGVACAHGGTPGFVYETTPDDVQRAPSAAVSLDVTADVISLDVDEQQDQLSGTLVLDNFAGAYGTPTAPILAGDHVEVSWGYYTATGNRVSEGPALFVESFEWRRAPGVSELRIKLTGCWRFLEDNYQRSQIVHAAADVWLTVLQRIFNRAGFLLLSNTISTRAATVSPNFTIGTAQSGLAAMRRALAQLVDRVRAVDTDAAELRQCLASDATNYTFATDHPIRELRFDPKPSETHTARVFGAGVFSEERDFVQAQHHVGDIEQVRDNDATTAALALNTATAVRRRLALDQGQGTIVCQPNVGQELLDVVAFSDPNIQAGVTLKRRVRRLGWHYARAAGDFWQTIHLGAM